MVNIIDYNRFQCQIFVLLLSNQKMWYLQDYQVCSTNILLEIKKYSVLGDPHSVPVRLVAAEELRDGGHHQHHLVVRVEHFDRDLPGEWRRHLHIVEIVIYSHHDNPALKLSRGSLTALSVSLVSKVLKAIISVNVFLSVRNLQNFALQFLQTR